MKLEDVVSWVAVGVGIILILVVIAGELTEVKIVATFGLGFDRFCYPNNTCELILYSGVRNVFEDGVWKRAENARDLTPYFKIVYLEHNPNYNISIVELNYTDVKFNITVNGSHTGKKVPIKFCYNKTKRIGSGKGRIKEISICKSIQAFMHHPSRKFNFSHSPDFDGPLAYYYVFGHGSTTITLQDNVTENLADVAVAETNPNTNYGNYIYLWTENDINYLCRSYNTFNLSSIPSGQTIDDATYSLYYEGYTYSDYDINVSVHHVNDSTWDGESETTMTWNNQVCGTGFDDSGDCNLTEEDRVLVDASDLDNWYNWTVKNMVKRDYDDGITNVTIATKATDEISYQSGKDVRHSWDSGEAATASLKPKLKITYSPAVVDTCTPGATVWNMNCADNCTKRAADSPINVGGPWNVYGSGGRFLCDGCTLNVSTLNNNATNCEIIFNGTFKYTQGV